MSGKRDSEVWRAKRGEKARSHICKVLSAPEGPRKEARRGSSWDIKQRRTVMAAAAVQTQVDLYGPRLSRCLVFCQEMVRGVI